MEYSRVVRSESPAKPTVLRHEVLPIRFFRVVEIAVGNKTGFYHGCAQYFFAKLRIILVLEALVAEELTETLASPQSTCKLVLEITGMSPYSIPQSVPESSSNFSFPRAALVLILSALITAGSLLMIGPQIILMVPLSIIIGIIFAVRRSYWSSVLFGYPLTFGLLSAWIGSQELAGYQQTAGFAVSTGIGLIGCALIAFGLWKSLPSLKTKELSSGN